MATITFTKGDLFQCSQGHGIVLDNQQVLLVTGSGGRTGWHPLKTELPADATPDTFEQMAFEKRFALEAVRVAIA